MAHKHSVYDTSLHFIIDGNTRLVKNSTEAKVTLVQYDHNSERITFELPRYIDGHDMSLCTNAQVHYINIERKTNRESVGVYECDDLQIAPNDENVVICSWLISKNATRFIGSLFFVIRFICSEGREITYSWNTARHTGLSVTDGIYNGEEIDEQYADILQSWYQKLFEMTGGNIDLNTGEAVKFWVGSSEEYEEEADSIPDNCIVFLSDAYIGFGWNEIFRDDLQPAITKISINLEEGKTYIFRMRLAVATGDHTVVLAIPPDNNPAYSATAICAVSYDSGVKYGVLGLRYYNQELRVFGYYLDGTPMVFTTRTIIYCAEMG